MSDSHEAMLDDVATYALGALAAPEATRVRDHLKSCADCRTEYDLLAPAALAVAHEAPDATPSPRLKDRVMKGIRPETALKQQRGNPTIVWPAYLVAAACFCIAIVSTLVNLSLIEQLKSAQSQLTQTQHAETGLARNVADEKTMVADLMDDNAQRYAVDNGQIVRDHNRLYITLHDLARPPRGKVYQAWTQTKGSKVMTPSVTFIPNTAGVAVVALPVDARTTGAVAVSVEPEGGSKAPTSTPVVVQSLN